MRANSRAGDSDRKTEAAVPNMFMSGWFTESFAKGTQPDYGYPKNHLPDVANDFELEVKTGFFSSK